VKVAFVVNDLQLSGGIGVVVEHARQLTRRHGFAVDLVLSRDTGEPEWRFRGLGDVPVHGMDVARASHYDVAIATWWETVGATLELPARRHAYFVQSLEDRFYRPHEMQRLAAAITHELPLPVITEARWIAETLEALTPQRRCLLVRNGVAKDVFVSPSAPQVRVGEPLRILVEGNPYVWFKGVPEALAAAAAMQGPRHVTAVSTERRLRGADEVIGPLAQDELALRYADSDVILKLSRVEGMFGPPLEGFHMGATCVVTAVTGHEEYVEHGENGLVVDWDDPRGVSRALDLLATDPAFLHRLRWGALATARGWPSWEQQGTVMAAALREVARLEPLPRPAFDLRVVSELRAGIERQMALAGDSERLRWRLAPLLALERQFQRRGVRHLVRPVRWLWGRLGRR
jgi:glycosyltransferase involved in cell wall biosynthesis